MEQKVFDLIAGRTGEALAPQGFQKAGVSAAEGVGTTALLTGENLAYSVFFDEKKKQFELRTCPMTDEGPDENWKVISRWLFDPEPGTSGMSEAESIANDFIETIEGPKRIAAVQTAKKRRKGDENNADPLFFFNRLVGVFPDLRAEIAEERAWYGLVRGVTFAREHVLPKMDALLAGGNPDKLRKLCEVLGDMYVAGDMDVRSLITIVLLNGMRDQDGVKEKMAPQFRKELAEAHKAALKYRGREVKPEKKKKEKKYSAEKLNDLR